MSPIVDGLEAEFGEQLTVLRLDAMVEKNLALQSSYGQRGHPSFVILDAEDVVVASFIGPQDEGVLREAVATAVGP